ncbi:MAG TPA: acVLRF1 family peptidyl-tRNA hydrolase [Propionibacteriaceae bacterium]
MSRIVSVPAGRIERWLDTFWVRHGQGPVTASDDGVAVAGTDGATARLRLLWPGVELGDDPLAGLVAAAQSPRRLGLLAVRADGHAVGLWDGTAVTESKRRGHYVQSRTAAGGWSQQRYARRRENQAKAAYEKAAGDVADIIEPVTSRLDGLVAAGNPAALKAVLADPRCRRTAALAAAVPLPHVELRDTSREALTDLAVRLLSVIIAIDEPD